MSTYTQLLREYLGHPIYLATANGLQDFDPDQFPSNYFRVLCILDIQGADFRYKVEKLVGVLLNSGCRYISSFGTAAEFFHEEADLVIIESDIETSDEDCILTTSHESLEEAVWSITHAAQMTDSWESCDSPTVVLLLESDPRVEEVRNLLLKLEDLDERFDYD